MSGAPSKWLIGFKKLLGSGVVANRNDLYRIPLLLNDSYPGKSIQILIKRISRVAIGLIGFSRNQAISKVSLGSRESFDGSVNEHRIGNRERSIRNRRAKKGNHALFGKLVATAKYPDGFHKNDVAQVNDRARLQSIFN